MLIVVLAMFITVGCKNEETKDPPKPAPPERDQAKEPRDAASLGGQVPPPKPAAGKPVVEDLGGGVKLTLMPIAAGKLMMGSPAGEEGRSDDEVQHEVILSKGFYMGQTEVTQGQWKAVMGGENPSSFKGDDLPVEQVSWNDAVAFCQKLSQKTGRKYRLPTEAAWEYACRAGTTTRFSFGDRYADLHKHGNYCDRSNTSDIPVQDKTNDDGSDKTSAVSKYTANTWGLQDMHGNVWEWCNDWFGDYPRGAVTDPKGPANGESRVARGGSWFDYPQSCRAAFRLDYSPVLRLNNVGFRVVLDFE